MTKHTPTPLFNLPLRLEVDKSCATIYDARGVLIPEIVDIELGWTDTSTGNYSSSEEAKERLEFIVTACNSHDELVEALKECMYRLHRLDEKLLKATGSKFECELGEITRGREALRKAGAI